MKAILTFTLLAIINCIIYSQPDSVIFTDNTILLPNIIRDNGIDTCNSCLKPYGKKFKVNSNFQSWNKTKDENYNIYSIEIIANNSEYLDLIFSKFIIRTGCYLRLYSSNDTYKEFNLLNSKFDGIKKVLTVKGDYALIAFLVPLAMEIEDDIELSSITYVYKNENFSTVKLLDCHHDVNCPEGDLYKSIIRSVVLIRNLCDNNGDCSRCSGSLLNNTNEDLTPYILTAHHCTQGADDNLDEAIFYFHYQASTCNGIPPFDPYSYFDYPYSITGAELKAQRTSTMGSDFALLMLIESIPLYFNVYFSGWSREWSLTGSNVVGIHHPQGEPKKISFGHVIGMSIADYINVNWDDGTVEDGSSGSPVYKDQQVVGQLSGGLGSMNCENLGDVLYGHFASSWGSTWGPSRRLRDWLDPLEDDPENWDGLDPNSRCSPFLFLTGNFPATTYQSEPVQIQAANTINISNMEVEFEGNYIFKAGNNILITTNTVLNSGLYRIESCSTFSKTSKNNTIAQIDDKSLFEIFTEKKFLSLNNTSINLKSLIIYPNPHPGIFTIEWNDETISEFTIQVFNMMGKPVYSRQHAQPGINQVDITEHAKGIYFVTLQSGDKVITERVVYQ
jgi:hypothetical protein